MPAAHLLEGMILKIQRSFPEHSIRSVESVLILERLCVSNRDLCWVGRKFLVSSNRCKMVADSNDVCALLIPGPALGQQLDNFGEWQPLLVIISWIEELVRIRDRIILADLGDEVAESWEGALELPTDKELLVDIKRLGGNSRPRRRQRLATSLRLDHRTCVLIRDGSLRERSPRRRGTCCTSSEAGSPLSVTTDGRQSCRHREQAPEQQRPLGQST